MAYGIFLLIKGETAFRRADSVSAVAQSPMTWSPVRTTKSGFSKSKTSSKKRNVFGSASQCSVGGNSSRHSPTPTLKCRSATCKILNLPSFLFNDGVSTAVSTQRVKDNLVSRTNGTVLQPGLGSTTSLPKRTSKLDINSATLSEVTEARLIVKSGEISITPSKWFSRATSTVVCLKYRNCCLPNHLKRPPPSRSLLFCKVMALSEPSPCIFLSVSSQYILWPIAM